MIEATTPGTTAKRAWGFRVRLLTLLILVACCAVVLWAARRLWEANHIPTAGDWARTLRSGRPDDRRVAALKLAEVGPEGVGVAVPALLGALDDESATVRAAATDALYRCLTASLPALGGAGRGMAREAVDVLLRVAARDPDPGVRGMAIQGSAAIARAALKATEDEEGGAGDVIDVNSLVATYADVLSRGSSLRVVAVQALGELGPWAESGPPPALMAALDDEDPTVRGTAALAVARFRTGVDPVIPIFLKALGRERPASGNGPRSSVRDLFAQALATIRPSPAAVPILAAALDSDDQEARRGAATVLGAIGPEASSALPALAKALERFKDVEGLYSSTGDTSAGAITEAIVKIAPPEKAIRMLTGALRSPSASARAAAAWFLGKMGPRAEPAIPALIATLRDAAAVQGRMSGYGGSVAQALGEIAPETAMARESITALAEALRAGTVGAYHFRGAAAGALGQFGTQAASAFPALVEAMEREVADDKPYNVTSLIAEAIGRVAPDETSCERTVALLETAARSARPEMRSEAAIALGILGAKAARAIPSLKALQGDRVVYVSSSATTALDQIAEALEEGPSGSPRRSVSSRGSSPGKRPSDPR
jgi:HEAT repeat protein